MTKTFIIAEAGVNHNGNIDIACQLVDIAANAGADAVKFQTFQAEALASVSASKAAYQQLLTDSGETQQQMLKRLELSKDDHVRLIQHCRQRHIQFLSTPFDMPSIALLAELGVSPIKIASGEITNLPYLRAIGKLKREVILSSGLSTLEEIGDALEILEASGTPRKNITVLHANTAYPTPVEDINLKAMLSIQNAYGVKVGYSDHSLGITTPIAAVALGAQIIEKHFTISRSMEGPDHASSLEPTELTAMVTAIRDVEKMLGNGIKKPSPSELINLYAARKSIVARRTIEAGELITEEHITAKRPGGGISPMQWDNIIGQKANRSYQPDEPLDKAL